MNRSRASAALAGAVLVMLSSCATAADTAIDTGHSGPAAGAGPATTLDVSCTPNGITVAGASVAATAAGVRLQVSSTTAPGTYLGFMWTGGGQGDPVPSAPTVWTLPIPPGRVELSCSGSTRPWPTAAVTVTDPDGNWRTATLADLGCDTTGGQPSWVARAGPGRGSTAGAAVSEVIRKLFRIGDPRLNPAVVTTSRAPVGYPAADLETWIISSAGHPYLTATAAADGAAYTANPDQICHAPAGAGAAVR